MRSSGEIRARECSTHAQLKPEHFEVVLRQRDSDEIDEIYCFTTRPEMKNFAATMRREHPELDVRARPVGRVLRWRRRAASA